MLQYGYGNFGESGYQLVSGDPFLQDRNRVKQLELLTHYVMNTSPSYREQGQMTYTGLLTDLGYRGETPRYYIQASGPSFVRGGSCAHGYAQLDEQDFFREPFLSVLRAKFLAPRSIQAMPAVGNAAYFPSLEFPPLDDSITPANIDPALLMSIVEKLLMQSRVILKLDREGDEAPTYARRVLLNIYRCLPYMVRKFCGFITNVPVNRLLNPESGDELPSAIKLVLVDGDAELPARLPGFEILDMNMPAPQPHRKEGTTQFLEFLVDAEKDQQSAARRERYFRLVNQSLESVDDQRSLPLQTYQDAFQMQKLADEPLSTSILCRWAGWLQRNQSTVAAGIRTQFLTLLKDKLTTEDVIACLMNPEETPILPSLEEFSRLWLASRFSQKEDSGSPAAVFMLLSAIFSHEDRLIISQQLKKWYSKQIDNKMRTQLLEVKGRWLPTPEAIKLVKQLENKMGLASPPQIRDDIIRGMVNGLSQRLKDLYENLQRTYDKLLNEEQRWAENILESVRPDISYAALAQRYDELQQTDVFPLSTERIRAGLGFAEAFGKKVADKFCELAECRPRPSSQKEARAFFSDIEILESSDLYKSGLLNVPLRQLDPLRNAFQIYLEYETNSIAKQLELLYRTYGPEFDSVHPALLKEMRENISNALMKCAPCAIEELSDLLEILLNLASIQSPLVRHLSAELWCVSTAEPEKFRTMANRLDEWARLGSALGCKVMVYFADGKKQQMPVQQMQEWMRWVLDQYTANVPEIVLSTAKEMPERVINESGSVQQLKLVSAALPEPERCVFYRCMLRYAVPSEYAFAKEAVVLLRKNGEPARTLLNEAGPKWDKVILDVYSDPMSGPQGEHLRQLKQKLPELRSAVEHYRKDLEKQAAESRRMEQMITQGLVMAGGILPMLLLWILGGAERTAVGIVLLILQLLQSLLVIGLLRRTKTETAEIRRYAWSALPGLLLTVIGIVTGIWL